MDKLIDNYLAFLDNGKTERECVVESVKLAEQYGYKNIEDVKSLKVGDKVYSVHRGKTILLFHIGKDDLANGLNILGAHIDSPRLDVKMNPLYEKEGLVYLDTHYYGGIKKYQWVAWPLAIHGVVCKKDGSIVNVVLGEDEKEGAFTIVDILPHMAQDQMKQVASEFIPGESLDVLLGLNEDGKENSGKERILALLNEKYGIEEKDFLSSELEIVPAGKARYLGLDKSMVLGYGQDDRVCSYTSLLAVLEQTETPQRTACCILADKEEIGSTGATGMDSNLLCNAVAEVVDRLGNYSELIVRRALKNSTMLSSDVTSAYDPMHSELYDKKNAAILTNGVVFNKYTGSRGKVGASDANPEFIAKLRTLLDDKGIKFQITEMGKVDTGGGGTIAKYCAVYGMEVIDCGIPVLGLHSPYEGASIKDIESMFNCYKAFLTL